MFVFDRLTVIIHQTKGDVKLMPSTVHCWKQLPGKCYVEVYFKEKTTGAYV